LDSVSKTHTNGRVLILNDLFMKTLDLEQMEKIEGGDACGAMAVAGAVLTIVALSNPITGLVGGLAAAFGASFSIAGIG
jgi:hypothetical protein